MLVLTLLFLATGAGDIGNIESHIIERINSATVHLQPFPHFVIDKVFPEDAYLDLLDNLPDDDEFVSPDECRFGLGLNAEGFVRLGKRKRNYWESLSSWLLSEKFMLSVSSIFYSHLKLRFFGSEEVQLKSSASLGRSKTGFLLGPHTDLPHRVITLVFYLPKTKTHLESGTSIYKSRDPDFKCVGGPHHEFSNFYKVSTMKYLPNTVFGFFKTDQSFHGVEPWEDAQFTRDTMQYEISDPNRAAYY